MSKIANFTKLMVIKEPLRYSKIENIKREIFVQNTLAAKHQRQVDKSKRPKNISKNTSQSDKSESNNIKK